MIDAIWKGILLGFVIFIVLVVLAIWAYKQVDCTTVLGTQVCQ